MFKILCSMQSVDNTELWYYYYEKQISQRMNEKKKIALVNYSLVNRGWHSVGCHDTGHCRPSSGLAILAAWKSICGRWQDERSQLTTLRGSTWYVATGTWSFRSQSMWEVLLKKRHIASKPLRQKNERVGTRLRSFKNYVLGARFQFLFFTVFVFYLMFNAMVNERTCINFRFIRLLVLR